MLSRKKMPQLRNTHNQLFAESVGYEDRTLTPEELTNLEPTQRELYKERALELLKEWDRLQYKEVPVSSDNKILDGHHRWYAAKLGKKPLRTFKLNTDFNTTIAKALKYVKEHPECKNRI